VEKERALDNDPHTNNVVLDKVSNDKVIDLKLYKTNKSIESVYANVGFIPDETSIRIKGEETVVDIESIVITEHHEVNVSEERNRIVGISINKDEGNEEKEDDDDDDDDGDDDKCGILTIYKKSGLHCELSKVSFVYSDERCFELFCNEYVTLDDFTLNRNSL
jgi:hypothetical protein